MDTIYFVDHFVTNQFNLAGKVSYSFKEILFLFIKSYKFVYEFGKLILPKQGLL